jgi:hypothetical protein
MFYGGNFMLKYSIVIVSATAVFSFALGLGATTASAKAPPCARNEMSIADERGGGRKICLAKSEWKKAKSICNNLPRKNGKRPPPMSCICQDGNSVGACGD